MLIEKAKRLHAFASGTSTWLLSFVEVPLRDRVLILMRFLPGGIGKYGLNSPGYHPRLPRYCPIWGK